MCRALRRDFEVRDAARRSVAPWGNLLVCVCVCMWMCDDAYELQVLDDALMAIEASGRVAVMI